MFGLLDCMKGITSPCFAVFGCVKTLRGISLAFNVLASVSDLRYFCSSIAFFSSLKRFSLTVSFSTKVHILLERESGILVEHCQLKG